MIAGSIAPMSDVQAQAGSADWQAWMRSLHGHAAQAHGSGREFYTINLVVETVTANWTNRPGEVQQGADIAGALQTIEQAGWRLLDIGYVFRPTKEQSHMMTQSANISGQILGVFTFRRVKDAGSDELPPMPE